MLPSSKGIGLLPLPLHSQRAGIYSLTCSYYFYFCMKNLARTVGTRTHPLSPFPEGSSQSSLGLCLATRLPPLREARGFAPPRHDGFAFLASAHTDDVVCRHIPNACYECTISRILAPRNTPWGFSPHMDDASVLLCVTLSPHARLISSRR